MELKISATVVFLDDHIFHPGDTGLFYASPTYYKPCIVEVTGHPKKLGIKLKEDGEIFTVNREAIKKPVAVTGYDPSKKEQKKVIFPIDIWKIKDYTLFKYQSLIVEDGIATPISL